MRNALIVVMVLCTLLVACGGSPTAAPPTAARSFVVDDVQVEVDGEGPAEVTLTVLGHFADDCSVVGEVRQTRSANTVAVDIAAAPSSEAACPPAGTPHTETVRLGTFDEPGHYSLRVNTLTTSFTIGTAVATPDSYDAALVVPLETPDGSVGLSAPLGWAVDIQTGIIRIADDASTLTASGPVFQGPSLMLIVATGPGRARDFGLDGATPNEVYAYFITTTGVRPSPLQPISDSPFPGLGGHQSDPNVGDAELRVLSVDESTLVVLIASCPPGEWSQFSPLFEAMAASVRVP